jgi:hypothetical protein
MTIRPMSAAAALLREHVARAHAQIEQLEAEHEWAGWPGDEPEPDEPEAGL